MTVVPAIFKNKKAFSLVELVVTMIIASILMLSVYFMMLIAYEQFNDLTGVSENFNNLQVFEKMFQRSAMTCVYYEVQNGNTFCFLTPNNNGYKYEKYEFKDMSTGKNGNGACSDISQAPFSKKIDKYSNDVNEDDDISGDNRTY